MACSEDAHCVSNRRGEGVLLDVQIAFNFNNHTIHTKGYMDNDFSSQKCFDCVQDNLRIQRKPASNKK